MCEAVTKEAAASEVYVADGRSVVMYAVCGLMLMMMVLVVVVVQIAVQVGTIAVILQVLKMLCVIEEVMVLLMVVFAGRLSTATGRVQIRIRTRQDITDIGRIIKAADG